MGKGFPWKRFAESQNQNKIKAELQIKVFWNVFERVLGGVKPVN